MKRKICLLLSFVLVACISLCACGGSGNAQNDFLTKNEWKDIGNEDCTFTFNSNGTGTFENRDTTWELNENRVSVSYQGSMRTMTLEFDVVENGSSKMLVECPNDIAGAKILVVSNNYENECQNTKDYLLEQAETLDWEAVYDEILQNEARASANHTGKIVKWTAKVFDISDNYCRMAIEQSGYLPVNPIDVYMSDEEIIKFDKFDEITVIGILEINDNLSKITGAFVAEN